MVYNAAPRSFVHFVSVTDKILALRQNIIALLILKLVDKNFKLFSDDRKALQQYLPGFKKTDLRHIFSFILSELLTI